MKPSIAAVVVGAVLTLSVLWLAGEQHRKNCLSVGILGAENVELEAVPTISLSGRKPQLRCSMLPWKGGEVYDFDPETNEYRRR